MIWRTITQKQNTPDFHYRLSFPRLLQESLSLESCKIMQKDFFDKCLPFAWLNWICFLLPNLICKDAISLYLLLRVNQGNWLPFEKLKVNYSLKRKKQSARVIRENNCMLKEAVTAEAAVCRCCSKYVLLKISHFAIFTGKHPWRSLFKIKLQAWKPATLLKRNSNPVFFCEYYEIFKNSFFHRTSQVAASALQIIPENKMFSFLLT